MPSLLPENDTANGMEHNSQSALNATASTTAEGFAQIPRNSGGSSSNFSATRNNFVDNFDGSMTTAPSAGFVPPTTALEQYRLQLYNYALHMERLRCPSQQQQYSAAAAAVAAAAAYAGNGGNNSASGYPGAAYVPSNRLALSMSLFPQRIFQPEDPKPQHSYIGLIAMAILSSSELKLVLSDIYQYILDNYPYFRTRGPGWRNSIRHNLSLNDCFVKSGRSANGKGHYWAIHPANMEDFRKGDFRRRKAQRKVRKHMGLSVDDAGTDSPSPPPLDLSSPPPPQPAPTLHSHQHPLTVAQQLAAFGYFQHQQQHAITPPIGQYNFRPVAARYYIAAAAPPTAALVAADHNHGQSNSNNQLLAATRMKATSATASVFANLYSQTRKRQFDMASLLAPDVKAIDDHELRATTTTTTTTTLDVGGETARTGNSGIRTTQLQHTVITKVTMNQCNHHLPAAIEDLDDQNDDIDVVDVEHNDEKQQMQQFECDAVACQEDHSGRILPDEASQEQFGFTTSIEPKDYDATNRNTTPNSSSRQSPLSDATTSAEFLVGTLQNTECGSLMLPSVAACRAATPTEIDTEVQTKNANSLETAASLREYQIVNSNITSNNNEAMESYKFGRCYGPYLAAAAAARRVGTTYNQ